MRLIIFGGAILSVQLQLRRSPGTRELSQHDKRQ